MKFTFEPESRPLAGFTIKRAIYRGGFGEVYYGLSDAGREVALKLLQNNTEIELRGVQQCLNLSHPNLVKIFDVKTDNDGDHWIVMEYVSGETLDAAIRRHPQGMPVEMVRKWLPGLVAGTMFLHSRGIVHRDLKPANIFMENGTVKIGDVGLSKFITPSRRSAQTQSVGTVYYMAPEVAKGRYGKEVDVYAAGIILYEMLTGHVPFEGESTGEILMKHLTEQPDLTKLPPRLRPVIAKSLLKEPEQRFRSLDEFQNAFEAAVLGRTSAVDAPHESSDAAPPNDQPESGDPSWSRQFSRRSRSGREHPNFKYFAWVLLAILCLSSMSANRRSVGPILLVAAAGLFGLSRMRKLEHDPAASEPKSFASRFRRALDPVAHPRNLAMIGLFLGLCLGLIIMEFASPSRAGLLLCLGTSGLGYGIGSILAQNRRQPTPTAASWPPQPVPAPPPVPTTPVAFRASRLSSTCGSAVLAIPFTLLLTALLAALKPSLFKMTGTSQLDPGMLGQFASVAIIGAWGIALVPSLLRPLDPRWLSSRWGFTLVGAVIGLAAWRLGEYLLVEIPTQGEFYMSGMVNQIGDQPLIIDHRGPTWLGYVAFFASLFWIRNWWELVSPDRPKRFRIGAVIKTLLCAWFVTLIFTFPTPWALACAAVLSCTVQLASPWNGEILHSVRATHDVRRC